jgi:chromosome segregation ATPase
VSPIWTIAAAVGWSLTGAAWWLNRQSYIGVVQRYSVIAESDMDRDLALTTTLRLVRTKRDDLQHQVDGLTSELAMVCRDRCASTQELANTQETLTEVGIARGKAQAVAIHLRDVLAEMTVQWKAARDGAEVAVAQAARWKGERDTAWELAESAVDRAARLESQRDTLQAKVDRMTSGLRAGRKPKVAALP